MPSNIFLYQLPKKEFLTDPDIVLLEDQDGTKTATVSAIRTYFFQDYVIPSLSATLFHATSAIINTVNVTNYELSGFTVYGNMGVNKVLHPSDPFSLVLSATNAMVIPVGSTAERPNVNVPGTLRYNSEIYAFEGNTGAEWVSLGETVNTVFSDLAVGNLSAGQNIIKGTSLEEFIRLLVVKSFDPTTRTPAPYVTPSYSIQSPYFNGSQSTGQVEIGDNTVNIGITYGNDEKRYIYGRRSGALNGAWDENLLAVYPNEFVTISTSFNNAAGVYAGASQANKMEQSNDNSTWVSANNIAGATSATIAVTRNYNSTSNTHYVRVQTDAGPRPANSSLAQSTVLTRWALDSVITNSLTVPARRKAFFKADTTTTLPTFNSAEIRTWGNGDNQQANTAGGNYYNNAATGIGFFFNPVAGSQFYLPVMAGTRRIMLAIPSNLRASFVYEPTGYDDSNEFDEWPSLISVNGRGASSNLTDYRIYYFLPNLGYNESRYIITLRNA